MVIVISLFIQQLYEGSLCMRHYVTVGFNGGLTELIND